MLEVIFIGIFASEIGKAARAKGRRGWPWVLGLIFVWFGAEFLAAVAVGAVWLTYNRTLPPDTLYMYVPGLLVGFGAGFLFAKFVDRLPRLTPPPFPGVPRTRRDLAPARAAAAAPSAETLAPSGERTGPSAPAEIRTGPPPPIFKFHCPLCGQRIAAKLSDGGTIGICPGCRADVPVPMPPG